MLQRSAPADHSHAASTSVAAVSGITQQDGLSAIADGSSGALTSAGGAVNPTANASGTVTAGGGGGGGHHSVRKAVASVRNWASHSLHEVAAAPSRLSAALHPHHSTTTAAVHTSALTEGETATTTVGMPPSTLPPTTATAAVASTAPVGGASTIGGAGATTSMAVGKHSSPLRHALRGALHIFEGRHATSSTTAPANNAPSATVETAVSSTDVVSAGGAPPLPTLPINALVPPAKIRVSLELSTVAADEALPAQEEDFAAETGGGGRRFNFSAAAMAASGGTNEGGDSATAPVSIRAAEALTSTALQPLVPSLPFAAFHQHGGKGGRGVHMLHSQHAHASSSASSTPPATAATTTASLSSAPEMVVAEDRYEYALPFTLAPSTLSSHPTSPLYARGGPGGTLAVCSCTLEPLVAPRATDRLAGGGGGGGTHQFVHRLQNVFSYSPLPGAQHAPAPGTPVASSSTTIAFHQQSHSSSTALHLQPHHQHHLSEQSGGGGATYSSLGSSGSSGAGTPLTLVTGEASVSSQLLQQRTGRSSSIAGAIPPSPTSSRGGGAFSGGVASSTASSTAVSGGLGAHPSHPHTLAQLLQRVTGSGGGPLHHLPVPLSSPPPQSSSTAVVSSASASASSAVTTAPTSSVVPRRHGSSADVAMAGGGDFDGPRASLPPYPPGSVLMTTHTERVALAAPAAVAASPRAQQAGGSTSGREAFSVAIGRTLSTGSRLSQLAVDNLVAMVASSTSSSSSTPIAGGGGGDAAAAAAGGGEGPLVTRSFNLDEQMTRLRWAPDGTALAGEFEGVGWGVSHMFL